MRRGVLLIHFARLIRAKARLGQSISRASINWWRTAKNSFCRFQAIYGRARGRRATCTPCIIRCASSESALSSIIPGDTNMYTQSRLAFCSLSDLTHHAGRSHCIHAQPKQIVYFIAQAISPFGCISEILNYLHLPYMDQICNVWTECTIL